MSVSLPLAMLQAEHLSIVCEILLLNPIPIFTVSSSLTLISFQVRQEGPEPLRAYDLGRPSPGRCPAPSSDIWPLPPALRPVWMLSSSSDKLSWVESERD